MSFSSERFSIEEIGKSQHSPILAALLSNYLDRFAPVYDLGCGDGYYLSEVSKRVMAKCVGLEGAERIPNKIYPWITHPVDVASSFTAGPPGSVICLNVAEFIARERLPVLLENINRHCRQRLVVSWMETPFNPKQVSCRDEFDIVKHFHQSGFKFQEQKTEQWRSESSVDLWWLEKSLYIFER